MPTPPTAVRLCRAPVLVAIVVCAAGCGGPHQTAPVSGRLTLDGNPLANAAVTFQPVATASTGSPGPGSGGFTDADGRYTLKLIGSDTPGALIGRHKVRITMVPPDAAADGKLKKLKPLPVKYSGKDSKLETDVPADGTSSADFSLTSK